jgi:hypothetical protein
VEVFDPYVTLLPRSGAALLFRIPAMGKRFPGSSTAAIVVVQKWAQHGAVW